MRSTGRTALERQEEESQICSGSVSEKRSNKIKAKWYSLMSNKTGLLTCSTYMVCLCNANVRYAARTHKNSAASKTHLLVFSSPSSLTKPGCKQPFP